MPTVNLVLFKSKTLTNGEHPIVLQIYHKKTIRIYLQKTCSQKYWDFTKQEPNLKHPNRKRMAMYVKKQKFRIDEVLMDMEEERVPFSVREFKRRFFTEEHSNYFHEYVQQRIEQKNQLGRIRTAEGYSYMLDKVNMFFPDLVFAEIDYSLLKKFEFRLRQNNFNDGGISNVLRTFRANIREAVRDGVAHYAVDPFMNFTIPESKPDHKALSEADLKKLFSLELSGIRELSRDMWICMFFLRGMECVDITYLTWDNINDGVLTYKRSKTGNMISISVHPLVMVLFEKYKEKGRKRVFPVVSDKIEYRTIDGRKEYKDKVRAINRALSNISKKYGFSVNINTKIAKHTFAEMMDNYTSDNKMLSDMLGHSDPKTSLRYTGRRKESKMAETIEGFMMELGIG